jgi:3-oxoacyl-(acyl-carrier-protein) synthase
MCNLLKRVVVTARTALQEAGVEMPDAIISGTGLGCIDNTERFLHSIMENGEQYLQPTFFMQSTHNIFSSLIAIELRCHGYNNTYVHRAVAFEHALADACLQLGMRRCRTALVGGYDELTDDYYIFLGRLGLWNFQHGEATPFKQRCFAGEAAVSMLLSSTCNEQTVCRLEGVELLYRPSGTQLQQALARLLEAAGCGADEVDALAVGIDGNPANDSLYDSFAAHLLPHHPVMQYRHLFGQSFTASALGLYAALTCLRRQCIPAHLLRDGDAPLSPAKRILLWNHYHTSHSLVLLSRC